MTSVKREQRIRELAKDGYGEQAISRLLHLPRPLVHAILLTPEHATFNQDTNNPSEPDYDSPTLDF